MVVVRSSLSAGGYRVEASGFGGRDMASRSNMVYLVSGLDRDILVLSVDESMLASLRSTLQEMVTADRQAMNQIYPSAVKWEVCCSAWRWSCGLGW